MSVKETVEKFIADVNAEFGSDLAIDEGEEGEISSCGRKTPSDYKPLLLDYHMARSLKVVTAGDGRAYVEVPRGDDLWGNLGTVLAVATVDGWGPKETRNHLLVPTYAYDRVVVAGLRCQP